MVKSTSEYFITESVDNLKRSLGAYKRHLSKAINSLNAILMVQPGPTLEAVNPSFTKPFGTHTFYQGGGGGWVEYGVRNRCSHERETLLGI